MKTVEELNVQLGSLLCENGEEMLISAFKCWNSTSVA